MGWEKADNAGFMNMEEGKAVFYKHVCGKTVVYRAKIENGLFSQNIPDIKEISDAMLTQDEAMKRCENYID